jgi:preprotein translocase subunit SecD
MNFYEDRKFMALILLFLAFLAGIYYYKAPLSGVVIMGAVIIFGSLSLMWKEPHIKISGLVLIVLLALSSIYLNGLKFGIDFVGGTRIPVTLDQSVDQTTMSDFVQTIKGRVSVLGLSEVKVRAIGDNQIYVEVPSNDEQTISTMEKTLSQQGVYQGIVDGRIAVSGDHIFRTTIRPLTGSELIQGSGGRTPPDWGVAFSVDREGANMFADAAKGKQDYPVYMYLDRPNNAVIFFQRDALKKALPADSNEKEGMRAIRTALKLQDGDIQAYVLEDVQNTTNITAADNKTKAMVSENASADMKALLKARGFVVTEISEAQMAPEFMRTASQVLVLSRLESIGLLTSPILSAGVTSGVPNYNFLITGSVQETNPQLKSAEAIARVKNIESILKGGALPVQITLGSRTTIPASLGTEFLKLSLITIAASLLVISIVIGLRYRNLAATLPIVIISLAEFAILMSILGAFTIDLAAMAGILAAIGVGVDAQIVITDELLKKDEHHNTREKIEMAFSIIKTNIVVAIFTMVPLLFSRLLSGLLLVEIIGFAESTILGAILGYLLTRPAYAAIVEQILMKEHEKAPESKTPQA